MLRQSMSLFIVHSNSAGTGSSYMRLYDQCSDHVAIVIVTRIFLVTAGVLVYVFD